MRLVIALLAVSIAAAQPGFHFERTARDSIRLTEDGAPVYVYQWGIAGKEGVPERYDRCCYVHPVWAPNGVIVTDDFPEDHYHHRGIFWAWSVVEIDGQREDLWTMSGVRKRPLSEPHLTAGEKSARLAVENGWFTGERQVVRERVEIVAHPAGDGARRLVFHLVFEALEPVVLRGDPVDDKGYGGFSVRFAPREKTTIVSHNGPEAKDSNMVPHRWAQLSGQFAGGPAVLRIDTHPDNPGHPNGWCIRHYGFLGVNYPGNQRLPLEPGKPVELRYTVTLHVYQY